jgi:hypothetical protein
MHFLRHMMSYLLPIPNYTYGNQDELPPEGEDYVITSRGNFVVTARNTSVIAKQY